MEFLADYFSEPLVGGFLFGATFHILIQQLDATIGVKKPRTSGLGHLFEVIDFFCNCNFFFIDFRTYSTSTN
jgi:MFS superfamily sulfate permease-like transporter